MSTWLTGLSDFGSKCLASNMRKLHESQGCAVACAPATYVSLPLTSQDWRGCCWRKKCAHSFILATITFSRVPLVWSRMVSFDDNKTCRHKHEVFLCSEFGTMLVLQKQKKYYLGLSFQVRKSNSNQFNALPPKSEELRILEFTF